MKAIVYRPLDAEQEASYLSIMRQGNSLRKKWAVRFFGTKRHNQDLRRLMVRETDPDKLNNSGVALTDEERTQLAADLPAMLAVYKVEMPMTEAYIALAMRFLRSAISTYEIPRDDQEDLQQDVLMKLADTIYGFTKHENRFGAYAGPAIRRHIGRKLGQNTGLSPLSESDRELVFAYRQEELNANGPVNFQKIVERLKLTKNQEIRLRYALIKCQVQSQCMPDAGWDGVLEPAEEKEPESTFYEDIDRAKLTPFERELVLTAQNPYHGWRAALARQFNVSRTYATLALKQALKKIERVRKKDVA